jgi:hypothetical protein
MLGMILRSSPGKAYKGKMPKTMVHLGNANANTNATRMENHVLEHKPKATVEESSWSKLKS